ncbi:protein KlaA [Pseudomonas floridensis]|uniref:Protein KlaA n=1 Tax=Pseudomonas floridensis TaxID=1958950 RepID=A0A1X0NAG1_9PSED|nr:protein KlaA [Pseudomonas floridensis]MEE4128909.1 protein KlaA [Pseudomonas viridiflava]MEE4911794.1 protein KlaA [Pseudomonas alliivorans]ORC60288.1 protein KlaA [Pseudomonas floridensis]
MTHSVVSIDDLKQQVLPELFAIPARLGEYGGVADSSAKIDQLSDLMESGSAAALAAKIAEVLSKMADASPEQITRKPTWLEKILGGAVEKQVRYQVARSTLEQLLAEAEGHAQGVRDTVSAISRMIVAHTEEAEALKVFIQAGREFLEENPLIGTVAEGEIEFDRPRERLARKLANLATLLASHELSVSQMKLSRAQALDMLDRFRETVTVLVPVWRQHTLTLITTKHMSPAMVEAASKAHQALMASLSESLNGVKH